ncbi:hypothetical protein GEMRC1_006649 [Eukaryota sp. GEM-RC1]
MPADFPLFSSHLSKNRSPSYWIVKDNASSRGRNISLFQSSSAFDLPLDVKVKSPITIQQYIANPLLIKNRKFDLRLYVLITASPFKVYLYDEGFARFCCLEYTLDTSQLNNLYIHLTNTSIHCNPANPFSHQIKPPLIDPYCCDVELAKGNKSSLEAVKMIFQENSLDFSLVWNRIQRLVKKSVQSCSSFISNLSSFPHSKLFEIFGFDVLIDSDLKPVLLEVNSSPSLAVFNDLDQSIKESMIADAIQLMKPVEYDVSVLKKEIQWYEKSLVDGYSVEKANSFCSSLFKGRTKLFDLESRVGRWNCLL